MDRLRGSLDASTVEFQFSQDVALYSASAHLKPQY
jgi:hypothetical protein